MSRPSIEFFLHPPSPPRPEEPCIVLPPVSSLLRDAPLSPPHPSSTTTSTTMNSPTLKQSSPSPPPTQPLPHIHEPSPQFYPTHHHHHHHHHHSADLVEPLPALTLSIPSPSSAFSSPTTSPYPLDTPQTSPISSPHPGLLLPPPCNTRRSRSLSNASTSSSVSTFSLPCSTSPLLLSSSSPSPSSPSTSSSIPCSTRRLSDPPLYSSMDHHHHHHNNHTSTSSSSSPPPNPRTSWQRPQSASPSLSPSNPPFVAKRKRGRPPNASRQVTQRDCYTFVTPTVWEVKQQNLNDQQLNHTSSFNKKNENHSSSIYNTTPSNEQQQQQQQQNMTPHHNGDGNMTVLLWPEEPRRNKGLNTFTSTRMDSTLSIPKKKRGRKPKVQLAGNSCFVWRDLTARRGANRKRKSPTPTTTSTTSTDEDRLVHQVKGIQLNSTTTTPSPPPSSC